MRCKALHDPNKQVRQAASQARVRIDPRLNEPPPVVLPPPDPLVPPPPPSAFPKG